MVAPDGRLLRRIRRDPGGRELIIIDNSYRDPQSVGGFYVDAPPPVVNIPYDRYIVDAEEASPDVIYQTMEAPPVQRINRRYTLDEIRYSPNIRMQMPSIDVNTITFETGSWTIPPDQAAKLQVIADGLNRAIQANPRVVFLIEGHTDAVGNEVDNLSLSDRRAQSAAELLTPAVRCACGEPDVAGLWRAVPEGADAGAERDQPARHRPQHHAAAQRAVRPRCRRPRPGTAPAAVTAHTNAKWPGEIPAIFVFVVARDVAAHRAIVGWAKARERRAHHYLGRGRMVGTLRFAHPTATKISALVVLQPEDLRAFAA
ncbi:hypothetical protein BRDID11002_60840 [Bradyrhizobium diazoefficiens]